MTFQEQGNIVAVTYPDQTVSAANETTALLKKIIENQANLVSHVLDLKQNLKNLTTEFNNFKTKTLESSAVSNIAQKEPSIVPELWKFTKLDCENDLIEFEKKIQTEHAFKHDCLTRLKSEIGSVAGKTSYDCALMLDRIIFTNKFWSSTAWTGGRKAKKRNAVGEVVGNSDQESESKNTEESSEVVESKEGEHQGESEEKHEEESATKGNKFVFSEHITFIDFFKQLVLFVNGSVLPENELKKFVQSRSRNAFYSPKTVRATGGRSKK